MQKIEIDLSKMCKKDNYGPVIFPNEMTFDVSANLCKLFDSEMFLIEDQTSVQMARSLMNQTKKGNYSLSTKASFTDHNNLFHSYFQ